MSRDIVRDWYEDTAHVDELPSKARLKIWEMEAARAFPAGGRILDIGCGAGREAFALAQMGFSVVGIDSSRAVIDRALPAQGVSFQHYDGEILPFSDGAFDVVVIWSQTFGLLYGTARKNTFLAECARVLRPGGLLSVSGHDRAYITANHPLCLDGGRFYPHQDGAIYWETFLPGELDAYAEGAGFEVLTSGRGAIYAPEDGTVLVCLSRKRA